MSVSVDGTRAGSASEYLVRLLSRGSTAEKNGAGIGLYGAADSGKPRQEMPAAKSEDSRREITFPLD